MKKLTCIMLVITGVFFLGLGGFSKPLLADTADVNQANRGVYLNIMTTTRSQYYMLNSLAGGKHNIEYMFNNEKENKNYKTTEAAVNNVSNMNLFFYSGNGNEPWITNFLNSLNKTKVGVVDLSRGIRLEYYNENGNKTVNPYYWLGTNEYKVMLYNAKSALQEKDPANRQFYEDNYNQMMEEINNTVTEFQKAQSSSKVNYTYLARNNDFEYLLNDLGINYTVIPKDMTFTEYINDNNLSPNNVAVIVNNTNKEKIKGLNVVKLTESNENISYMELLQNNINSLAKLYK